MSVTRLFSVAQAAELLSFSKSTVRSLIKKGEINPVILKIGTLERIRIPDDELQGYIDRNRRTGPE